MFDRICFVYPWATVGGVERVLLNRLIVFKEHFPDLDVDILFFCDGGGLASLSEAINTLDLRANIIVASKFPSEKKYDLVFCIDAPQAFELCEERGFKYLAECHTPYAENRSYLRTLPLKCELVTVPSPLFGNRVRNEIRNGSEPLPFVLRNFIPWDAEAESLAIQTPDWVRRPILFMGRLDLHKDPTTMLEAFKILDEKRPDTFFGLICGPQSNDLNIYNEINRLKIRSLVQVLPPVPFLSTESLLKSVRQRRGIFVSPSKGETFGLVAAEALAVGLASVLSDIPEHRYLVKGRENEMTYPLGDTIALAETTLNLVDNYEEFSRGAMQLRERISASAFVEDWRELFKRICGEK